MVQQESPAECFTCGAISHRPPGDVPQMVPQIGTPYWGAVTLLAIMPSYRLAPPLPSGGYYGTIALMSVGGLSGVR